MSDLIVLTLLQARSSSAAQRLFKLASGLPAKQIRLQSYEQVTIQANNLAPAFARDQ
jgi:hypothetical protein